MNAPAPPSPEDEVIQSCMARLDRALKVVHRNARTTNKQSPPTPDTKGFSPAKFKETKERLVIVAEDAAEGEAQLVEHNSKFLRKKA